MIQPHFLLVEDTPSDVDLALAVIKSLALPLAVHVCHDGQEVIDRLLPPSGSVGPEGLPRFIVTDLKMPRVDGLRMMEVLRAHPSTRHIPTVIFSSSSQRRDIERSYALGANAYCIKPMDFASYARALGTLIRFWGECIEPY